MKRYCLHGEGKITGQIFTAKYNEGNIESLMFHRKHKRMFLDICIYQERHNTSKNCMDSDIVNDVTNAYFLKM